MTKTLTTLLLALAPALALAAGEHAGHAHDMTAMHEGMAGMAHDAGSARTGQPGDPAKATRTIEVSMDDTMRFEPSQIAVKAGETVRFFIRNKGRKAHEMVLGSEQALREHAALMRKMPDMQHAEANMIHLAAGQRGAIVWQFDQPGQVDFACLLPNHMENGMVGKIQVD